MGMGQNLLLVALPHPLKVRQKALVSSKPVKVFLGYEGGKAQGVFPRSLPQAGVDSAEKLFGVVLPGPPKVLGKGFQKGKGLWNSRKNLEGLKISHDKKAFLLTRSGQELWQMKRQPQPDAKFQYSTD
jgi:hypothetical protein